MALFGRKKEEAPDLTGTGVPISQVLAMKAQGMNNNQIANQLRAQGYPLTQIRDAIAQADIKSAVSPEQGMGGMQGFPELPELPEMGELPPMELPEMPELPGQMPQLPGQAPQFPNYPQQQMQPQVMHMEAHAPSINEQLVNELQRIVEEIIEEKWKSAEEKINVLDVWKTKLEDKITEIDNKTTSMSSRLDGFSRSVLGQTDEYQKTMTDVNAEMQAIEKIMGKLIPALSDEIKELRSVVEDLRGK
jgi:DNA-binding transcriptional MerR regulator